MAGVKTLRKIQGGLESGAGTAVAATWVHRGEGTFEDLTQVVFPPEDVGYLGGTSRSYIPKVGGRLNMVATPATFEQLPYVFAAGIEDTVAGTADGSGYIYLYTAATTAQKTIKAYTLEAGDNQQAEEMAYCFVDGFTLSGKGGDAVMMQSSWLGRQISQTTFTTLTAPTVEEILFSKGKIYVDAATATIGTTQITSSWLAFELQGKTGFNPVYTGDGDVFFTFPKQTAPEFMLNLTFEHDNNGEQLVTDWRAQTVRNIRMQFDGIALLTPGATYTYKALRIDLAGKFEKVDPIGDQDGNDIITASFRVRYDPVAAKFAVFSVVNLLATLV